MLVTIIIPVYNVEKYIDECICSVLGQSFSDWELLLINDGSTDSSGFICDSYAKIDKRIKVIHKANTGVSDTRNIGLDVATGKYVLFLDADDYWYKNVVLEKLVNTVEEYNLDIVRGEYKAVDQYGNDLFERPLIRSKRKFSNKVLSSGLFYTQILCGENFLVLSLIRREAIGKLRFNTELSFLEDMDFYAHLLLHPLRCMFIPFRFYSYRKIASSASHTLKIKNLADGFSMCHMFDECCICAVDEELKKAYRYNSIMKYYLTLKNLASPFFYNQRHLIISKLSLESLQKDVCLWAKQYKGCYPIFIYIKPKYSILILRYMIIFKNAVLRIGSACKQKIRGLKKCKTKNVNNG